MRSLIENRISALLEGQDQVYYHGTRALFPFNEFAPRLIGTGTSSSGQKFGGFFFTSEQENAEFYAEDFVAKIRIKDIKPAPEGETHPPTVLRMAIESSQNLKLEDVLDGSVYSDIVVVPTSNIDDIEIIEWIFVGDKEFYFDQLDKLFFNLDDYDPEDEDNIDDDGNVMPPYIDTYQIDSLLGQMELSVKSMMSVPIFNEYYNTVEERLSKEYGLVQEIINNRISALLENPQKAVGEYIKGGEADSKSVEDIAQKHEVPVFFIKHELSIGSKIELEHTDDKALAREIAMDHLWEIPDYYTRLEKMEKDADLGEANPVIAVDDIPKGHDARVVDEEWDYDEDQMNYTTTSVSGEFYHGTSIDEGEVYRELDPNYSDWEAIWFANDENISQEFGENRTNDGDTQVVYTVEINSDKIVYLGQQDFEDIKEHYHLEDLREAIPILRQAGFDGWQTLGSIGWNQYDDFAIWNMDVVTIKSIMLMDAEGEWSEKMSLDQAQEIVSSKEGIDEANPIIPIDDIPKGHFARNVGIVSW